MYTHIIHIIYTYTLATYSSLYTHTSGAEVSSSRLMLTIPLKYL